MKVIHSEEEFRGCAAVAALGMFDGVHIGHQALIRTAVHLAKERHAQSVVCTFDRHPLSLLCPERAPAALLSLEENLRKFELLGADYALVKPFTQAFAAMLPEDYIELLVDQMQVRAIVIGENYTFGREGRGNAKMVRLLAAKFGYEARVVQPVLEGERMVSSTRIRSLLASGDIAHAEALLAIAPEMAGA